MTDKPIKICLKAGERYSICTYGASKCIHFCDNSHRQLNEEKGTQYKSLKTYSQTDVELYVNSKNWDQLEK